MEQSQRAFAKRQKAIQKKHARMARGYVTKLDKNGNFVQKPDNKAPRSGFRVLLLLALAFLGFKALVLAGLGTEDYQSRVAALEAGAAHEKVGAWMMQVDPVTEIFAGVIQPYLG